MIINSFFLYFLLFVSNISNIYCYNCPKDICGNYTEYSQCWYNRMYQFDYCLTFINKNNTYIKNCIETYTNPYNPVITINSKYVNQLYTFKQCNNTRNEYIKKQFKVKNGIYQFLSIGKCFYNIKNKVKKIGKDENNEEINCFNLPKNYF